MNSFNYVITEQGKDELYKIIKFLFIICIIILIGYIFKFICHQSNYNQSKIELYIFGICIISFVYFIYNIAFIPIKVIKNKNELQIITFFNKKYNFAINDIIRVEVKYNIFYNSILGINHKIHSIITKKLKINLVFNFTNQEELLMILNRTLQKIK